jgi:hypothetical protein
LQESFQEPFRPLHRHYLPPNLYRFLGISVTPSSFSIKRAVLAWRKLKIATAIERSGVALAPWSTETADGPLFELTNDSPLAAAALLIVDECSMVDARLGNDILSFKTPTNDRIVAALHIGE